MSNTVTKYGAPVVGTPYGMRVVASDEVRMINARAHWLMRCSCGDESWVSAHVLLGGRHRRCRACSEKLLAERKRAPADVPRVVPHAPKIAGKQRHALQRVVDWLATQPEPRRMAEIVGRFGTSAVQLTRTLGTARRLGLVERVPATVTEPERWRAVTPRTEREGVAA